MSVLVDFEILDLIDKGEMEIDPFDHTLVNPASLDVRLGSSVGVIKPTDKYTPVSVPGQISMGRIHVKGERLDDGEELGIVNLIDPTDPESFRTHWKRDLESYILQPYEFVLAPMYERMKLPNNVSAQLTGKSSLGRLGIANSILFAGFHDPGFAGTSVMELYNASPNAIILKPLMKIGQLVFHRMEDPDETYATKGRYQNQGPHTGSKGC